MGWPSRFIAADSRDADEEESVGKQTMRCGAGGGVAAKGIEAAKGIVEWRGGAPPVEHGLSVVGLSKLG